MHERIYRVLIRAYPRNFRADHEQELLMWFRDHLAASRHREGFAAWFRFWGTILSDLIRTVPAEHLAAMSARPGRLTKPRRGVATTFLDRIIQDLTYAARQLRRRPAFTCLTVGTLGVGIGAATAMFSLVKAVVLDPLPYPDQERLISLNQVTPDGLSFSVSMPDFIDFRDRLEGFEYLAALTQTEVALQTESRPIRLTAARVTRDFFPLFGGEPVQGRLFSPAEFLPAGSSGLALDNDTRGTPPVALISYRMWQSFFGGAPDAVGQRLPMEGRSVAIAGVMPMGWEPVARTDLWFPLASDASLSSREDSYLDVVGRLHSDVGLETARSEADAVANALGEMYPATNEGWGLRLTPFKEALVGRTRIQTGWVLLGAVGLLLLLACASVSNLLIARATTRRHEMGLRTALGAGRLHLVQQLLTESIVVSLFACGLGVALASFAVPLIQTIAPVDTPRVARAAVDLPVMLFSLGVGLLTSLIFGMSPVLHVVRRDGIPSLGSSQRTGEHHGDSLRGLLVGAQVAITVTLLVGAGLLGSTFQRMQRVDTGLPVATGLSVPLAMDRYPFPQRSITARGIRTRLEAVPGVAAAGSSNIVPFSGGNTMVGIAIDGRVNTAESAPFVRWRAVGDGYFHAVNARPIAGRIFEPADFRDDAESVVVLGEALARRVAGTPDAAVGHRIAMGWNGTNWRRVVGVVPDIEDVAVTEDAPLVFFFPGEGGMNQVAFVVRLIDEATALPVQAIRRAVWAVDPTLPVPTVEPLDQTAGRAVAAPRFNVIIVGVFGVVALVIAVMGVYGVTLLSVNQRTREIGVRIALGARPRRVVRMILVRGLLVAGLGVLAGLMVSAGLARSIESLLFRTSPLDPRALLAACAVAGVACALATWLPARRAGRTDPVDVLRVE